MNVAADRTPWNRSTGAAWSRSGAALSWSRWVAALLSVALAVCSCAPPASEDAEERETPNTGSPADALSAPSFGCGYEVRTGTYPLSRGRYGAWVRLENVSGERGRSFRVFLDADGTHVDDVDRAHLAKVDGGYVATASSALRWHAIGLGESYRFDFAGHGRPHGLKAYVLSINGAACDETAPSLELTASPRLVTSEGTLALEAAASDDAALAKVVFFRDGTVIGERSRAPYTLNVKVSGALNGRHRYSATAVDVSGNETSDDVRVLVAIGNRFVGTAVGRDSDYTDFPAEFTQVTPENAGKWGSVEATRDEMKWDELDRAYAFAKSNGLRFKLHTLVWGQQEPAWLAALPPEEQLAEIEEWMQLLGERYPDVALVDVVNEPLHAPPSYKAALGGDGETGWDWVIGAFEMARRHFPNSELILNEYLTLMLDEFTDGYLDVADVLAERDLIDGIGEQAHYLERTEIPLVEEKLGRLAATGLPIYVSEFDVNIANDAHQANRMRDLFSTFWNNPSVLGVTFWGYRQGNTWRQDAFLVRTDGTRRPAFDWLSCALARRSDCTVPEYVPQPRVGKAKGIGVEAEEYDDAQGVAALGDVLAYTDDGDWASYGRIEFQDAWDAFSVTYSKGNDQVGFITVHLDTLDSEPKVTLELAPTGDWGRSQTIEVPWPPIAGSHTAYLAFHGVDGGVANIDRVRFGIPTPTGPGSNLVTNSDFENGTNSWFGWGGTIGVSTARAHDGAQSLVVTGRSDGAGTAACDLTSAVEPGSSYPASVFVTIGGAPQAPVYVTAKVTCEGQGDTYTRVAGSSAVADGVWTELAGTLVVPDCTVQQVLIYVEGPPAGVDLYVDDVSVLAPG